MIVEYDLTDAVVAIAGRVAAGGRLLVRYATPAWVAELKAADGPVTGKGPTASQAIEDLGRQLRQPRRRGGA